MNLTQIFLQVRHFFDQVFGLVAKDWAQKLKRIAQSFAQDPQTMEVLWVRCLIKCVAKFAELNNMFFNNVFAGILNGNKVFDGSVMSCEKVCEIGDRVFIFNALEMMHKVHLCMMPLSFKEMKLISAPSLFSQAYLDIKIAHLAQRLNEML